MNHSISINRSFRNNLDLLHSKGLMTEIRGTKRYEIFSHQFCITKPQRRILTCPFRYNNMFAVFAEVLWVFGGRNDLEWLGAFLPNAYKYSDDNKTWPGAYGPRLRAFEGFSRPRSVLKGIRREIDQIKNIVSILSADLFSTQAVMTIYSPDRDQYLVMPTKDTPCTMSLQFLVRENRMHMICNMRSNDILYGCYNINVFEWSFLQEIVANIFNLEVGNYYHNAGSFHYYDNMTKRITNILASPFFDIYDYIVYTPIDGVNSYDQFNYNIDSAVVALEEDISAQRAGKSFSFVAREDFTSDYIYSMAKLSEIFLMIQSGSWRSAGLELLVNPYFPEDFRIAGLEYYFRRLKKENKGQFSKILAFMNKKLKNSYAQQEIRDFIVGNW